MKNRINLYLEEFKPQITLISLNLSVLIWVTLLLIVVGLGYMANQSEQQAAQRLETVQAKVNDRKAIIKVFTEQRDNVTQNPQLLRDLEALQRELQVKQLIFSRLAGKETEKGAGFSALMHDLARKHNKDIWLTSIQLDGQQLRIRGATVDSAAVPAWISSLSDAKSFAGKEFADTKMYREDDDRLSFELSTQLTDEGIEVQDE